MLNQNFPGAWDFNKGYDPSSMSSAPQMPQMDKAWYDAVANIVATVVPAVIPDVASAITKKGYEPGTPGMPAMSSAPQMPQMPQMDKAWYDTVASIVANVVPAVMPAIASAVGSKGYEPGTTGTMGPLLSAQAPQMDKAWYDTVANLVSTIVPAVIPVVASAITKKGYQPGSPGMSGMPGPALPPQMEKAWYDTVANLVSTIVPAVMPVVASAITKKGYQPGSPGMPGMPGTGLSYPMSTMDKAWYDTALEVVKNVVPVVAPIALGLL